MSFPWPAVLIPRAPKIELRNSAIGGGRSLSGAEQRAFSDAGRWELTYSDVPTYRREQILAWRATIARLRAGEQAVAKVYDLQLADGARETYSAVAGAAAAARSTSITVNTSNIVFEPGTHFCIGDRLYRVTAVTDASLLALWQQISEGQPWDDSLVWWDDPADGAGIQTLQFLPPLRAAVASGAALRAHDLTLLCQIASLDDGDLDLDLGWHATPSITLIEY